MLLLEHLDGSQRQEWDERDCQQKFTVRGASGREYTVHRHGGVSTPETSYCLQPNDPATPWPDVMLAHKLWIEADEAGFLAQANRFRREQDYSARFFDVVFNPYRIIEDSGSLHFDTVDQAREWAEARNWDVELSIDRRDFPPIFNRGDNRWARALRSETRYEVNGVATDAHTVEMLRQAAAERYVPVNGRACD